MKTMFGKRYPNCVKKEEVEIEEKKMVKVKLNPEKKIGVKVTDIGPVSYTHLTLPTNREV